MPRKPASKSKARAKKKPEGPFDAVRWDQLRDRAKPVGIGAGILTAGIALTLGINALNARAATHLGADRAADEIPITIRWPALSTRAGDDPNQTWLPKVDQDDILRRARAAVRAPAPLSAAPLAQITAALDETGWFRTPPSARRDGNGAITVDADWRVPAAVVRHGGWDHLVSWRAMPMPRRYGPGSSNQRVILNAAFAPGPTENPADTYRRPWPGEDVAAALEILRVLAQHDLVAEVEAIDVAHHASGMIELATVHGSRIEWGAAPGDWRPGQATDDERIARLKRLSAEFGRIDGAAARVRIAGAHVERLID